MIFLRTPSDTDDSSGLNIISMRMTISWRIMPMRCCRSLASERSDDSTRHSGSQRSQPRPRG